ncbi:MAG: primosomal protein N', partial [Clostridiaceae bacterium]|nr:primosomal protein N' [Clostridiaceae bacterium]
TQVAGRAGRGKIPGRVIIQSYNTEDFSILTACSHDYESFYRKEILLRKEMGYPPFTNIATVIMSGINDRITMESSKAVKGIISEYLKNENTGGDCCEILGPMKPPVSRVKNRYRWRLIIKCKDLDILVGVLTHVSDEVGRAKGKKAAEFKDVELYMDINPVNML